ncbi:hypothetical protein [Chromobacterium phragmitis]|uniref:hypothetical protein n=1 Tax=Chromobacterium phragmitis TaxID=2202141 RepID=UPI0011AE7E07|nr:hypothetical protein [Chromobacterium phragmitis]
MAEVDGGIISEQVNSVKLLKIYSIFFLFVSKGERLAGSTDLQQSKPEENRRRGCLGKAVRRLIFLGVWEDLMRLI